MKSTIITDWSGIKTMIAQLRRADLDSVGVEVYVDATESRSAEENFAISLEQAKNGRDPWHVSDDREAGFMEKAIDVVNAVIDRLPVSGAVELVGRYIVQTFQLNFEFSKSVRGPMKTSPTGYVDSKQRRHLDPRPLIATGQLRRSIKYRTTS